jgi:hypothetical protein
MRDQATIFTWISAAAKKKVRKHVFAFSPGCNKSSDK